MSDHYPRPQGAHRGYDPATGRFTQQDPIGIAGGLNLYGYANGDPINFSDPFGLMAEDCDPPDDALCKRPRGMIAGAIYDLIDLVDQLRDESNQNLPSSEAGFRASGFTPVTGSIRVGIHDNFDGFPETKWLATSGREGVTDGRTGQTILTKPIAGSFNFVTPLPFNRATLAEHGIGGVLFSNVGHLAVDFAPAALKYLLRVGG